MRREIWSFDVFDTVLTRRVGSPDAVFPLVADRLAAELKVLIHRDAFAATRKRAERNITARRGRPASLLEIYDEVSIALSLPRMQVERLVATELAVERELSVPVAGIFDALRRARDASIDNNLIFVSDTPHPEEFIVELLATAGALQPGDRVYASATRGASKSSGGLMTLVAQEVTATSGHEQPSFRHVGDNPRSDVAAARLEGWSAQHRPHARLNRYEEILEQHAQETVGLSSWLAGASRLARLEMVARGASPAIAAVAAGVTAPMLIGFALWVAAQARQRQLRRLYFVARDGEVMLRVARPLLAILAPEVECRYLYGSRQAWIFASSAFSDQSLADWVAVKRDVTVRSALARVALTPEEVWNTTRLPFAEPHRADRPMGEEDRQLLAEALQRVPLVDLVKRSARSNAAATLDYLRQEGVNDGTPSALVDVGWNGFTARAFDHLVHEAGGKQLAHLFLGLFRAAGSARAQKDPPDMTGWLFDDDLGRGQAEPLPGPNVVIEMFCAGTEGRVQHYRREGGRVLPELNQHLNQPVLDWGLDNVRSTIDLVTEHVLRAVGNSAPPVDLAAPIWRSLSAFWTSPSDQEVRAWGSFPWEEETWPPYYPVAQSLAVTDAVRRIVRGDGRIRRHNSWRAGSARVSGYPWRAVLEFRAWQEKHAARLRRLPRAVRLRLAGRRR